MLTQLSIIVFCHTILAETFYDIENVDLVQSLFEDFIKTYDRNYEAYEKKQRLGYFKQNLDLINRSNERNPLAQFDISTFSDRSPAERNAILGNKGGQRSGVSFKVIKDAMPREAPETFDWRSKNAVTAVKNQGRDCESSWAFAVTGNVEGQYAIKYKKQLELSAQQILDCDLESDGCDGGDITKAFTMLLKRTGLESEIDYPYRVPAEKRKCTFNKSQIAAKVVGYNVYQYEDEDEIKELLYKVGPLAISVDAFLMVDYKKGILTDCSCGALNRGTLLVGYGTENGTDYWTLKNAWGPQFGENGYIRIQRGVTCLCIGEYISSAVLG